MEEHSISQLNAQCQTLPLNALIVRRVISFLDDLISSLRVRQSNSTKMSSHELTDTIMDQTGEKETIGIIGTESSNVEIVKDIKIDEDVAVNGNGTITTEINTNPDGEIASQQVDEKVPTESIDVTKDVAEVTEDEVLTKTEESKVIEPSEITSVTKKDDDLVQPEVTEASDIKDSNEDSGEVEASVDIKDSNEDSGEVEDKKEELDAFSDDDIVIDDDLSSDSESSSSDDGSSSDSDSDSDSDSGENSEAEVDSAGEDEDNEGETKEPIVSKNEVINEVAPTIAADYKIPENAPLQLVGTITLIVDRSVIIKANVSGEFRILKESSVFCFKDRTVLGLLFETFGRIQSPVYRVQFNSEEEVNNIKSKLGEEVFYVVPDSQFVYTESIKQIKGTDASNCHDEELPEEEQEFSDDEAEAAAKLSKKKRKNRNKNPENKKRKEQESSNNDQLQVKNNSYKAYGYNIPAPNNNPSHLPNIPQGYNNQVNGYSQPQPQAYSNNQYSNGPQWSNQPIKYGQNAAGIFYQQPPPPQQQNQYGSQNQYGNAYPSNSYLQNQFGGHHQGSNNNYNQYNGPSQQQQYSQYNQPYYPYQQQQQQQQQPQQQNTYQQNYMNQGQPQQGQFQQLNVPEQYNLNQNQNHGNYNYPHNQGYNNNYQ